MKTSKNLTELNIEGQLTFFPEASPASQQVLPENERAKQMIVGSGKKLLGFAERLNRPSFFLRMFLACSHWRMARHLKGYSLRWKPKGTRQNRLLYQLAVSGRGTDGIESGFWATPTEYEDRTSIEQFKKRMKQGRSLERAELSMQVRMGMLPTPTAMETRTNWTPEQIKKRQQEVKSKTNNKPGGVKTGNGFGLNLSQAVKLLPTPTAHSGDQTKENPTPKQTGGTTLGGYVKMFPTARNSDYKGASKQMDAIENGTNPGNNGKLNPTWVEWLQGYPQNWTDIGIKNRETSPG